MYSFKNSRHVSKHGANNARKTSPRLSTLFHDRPVKRRETNQTDKKFLFDQRNLSTMKSVGHSDTLMSAPRVCGGFTLQGLDHRP
ncbi:hypothetical protein GWI33_017702 [Rhynchophorus ferrugineus]|uniref:Uncharacterized protein n=1 Tax=Rhynchophorus ferrugineus TaxID=354439 RepID=A0A834M264_RHYFE|nr:hypothetical protein GWI33_017702 [Rhynchophorus ferrugineus]